MKKFFTFFILLVVCGFAVAKPIDEATAKQVGQNFLATRTTTAAFKTGLQLELAVAEKSKAYNAQSSSASIAYYYIFNVANGDGFVIVSADDKAIPVLGYSDAADFNPTNIAPQTAKWLEGYKAEIRSIIQSNATQSAEVATQWQELIQGKPLDNTIDASVSPLVQTKWDQSPYYNALCPYDAGAAQRTVSGCVATAMAQVMKFWNYPTTGTGNHSYNHSSYGTLSANFGATTYNWGSMPNTVSSSNSAVATLMYHCGVSVDMNYDVAANGGSGAYVISSQSPVTNCAEYAFETYFGYKTSLQGVERVNYSQTQWMNLIKGELNAGRPVLYAGFGSGGGHAFVCDGYDNNDFLHFNWGWSGAYDGYFSVNGLNPGGVGTGGGTGGFNSGHQAIIGIEPPSSAPVTLDLRLYSAITVNPNPIQYGQSFTVTLDIANYGTSAAQNFSGDYTVAVFNANNEFVATVETMTGMSLDYNKHYTNSLVFSTGSISALTPGEYKIGVYYKTSNATQWTALANGNYQNFITVDVQGNNTNPLRLYSAITTTPTAIVRNQTFTVTVDIVNLGVSTFIGDVTVDIHKSDGTWIRELSAQNGLVMQVTSSFAYRLSFTITGGIADPAGTYQLFIWDKPNNGNWELLGSGAHANPITIQVVEPALYPDKYEVNNTEGQAYNLPISFLNNIMNITTAGSTCHKGNDYDYYKVVLPAGYSYSVSARLHDSYNSGNGNTYTFDGLLSYSIDGNTLSDAYDAVLPSNITVNGGSTVYFLVSPYFVGETGTYLFETTITRSKQLSPAKEITGFSVTGIVGNAVINSTNATVDVVVTSQTDIATLTPVITVSNLASINPPSGAVRNFTNPVVYTVTAEDLTTKQWTVKVTKQSNVSVENPALANSISVYPNPAVNVLHIDANQFTGVVTTITLTTLQGQVIQTEAVSSKVSDVSLNGLQSGIYLVQIHTNEGVITKKITKQ